MSQPVRCQPAVAGVWSGQFGITLLDRSTRPLVVTEAGKLYLEMCRDVLRTPRRIPGGAGAAEERGGRNGSGGFDLFGGAVGDVAAGAGVFAAYPEARLEVEYLRPEKVYEAVVGSRRPGLDELSGAEQRSDRCCRGARRKWWWRRRRIIRWREKAEVRPEDLEGLDFVGFDEDLPIRRDIDRFLREHHVHVNMTLHFDNLQMIKEAVAHGSGVSIMPARIMEEEIRQGRLVPIPIAKPELYRPVGIVHRRKKRFHRAGQAFLDLLREPPAGVDAGVDGDVGRAG